MVWSLSDGLHRQIRGPVPLCCDDYQADGGEEERERAISIFCNL